MSETKMSENNSSDEKLSSTQTTDELNKNCELKDNGAEDSEESSPKKIKLSNDVNDDLKEPIVSPTPTGRGRPSKEKVAKRLNQLEKTAKEGEALLQNLGHKDEDTEGEGNRRKTRSQTRGTPPAAPAPKSTPKKSATPKTTPLKDNSSPGAPRRRGRPPKNSITNNSVEKKTESKANSDSKAVKKSESTEESTESEEKVINNSNETNNTNDVNPSEQSSNSNDSEAAPEAEEADDSKAEETETIAKEQKNDKTKANSISGDSSNSVPVIDTQQTTPTPTLD